MAKFSTKDWLENPNRDYAEAVAWLLTQGPRERKLARRSKGTDKPYVQKNVIAHIKIISRRAGEVVVMPEEVQSSAPAVAPSAQRRQGTTPLKTVPDVVPVEQFKGNFSPSEFDTLPEDVQVLEKKIKAAHAIRAAKRGELIPELPIEKRKEAQGVIVDMTNLITDMQAQVDFFKKHGQLPKPVEEGTELPNDMVEVLRLIKNAGSRISKHKAKLKKNADDAETKAKLEEDESLKAALEAHKQKLEDEPVQNG